MDRKDTSKFQIFFYAIFGVVIFVGFIALLTSSGSGGSSSGSSSVAKILIWGTYPEEQIRKLKNALTEQDKNIALNFDYVEKRLDTFSTELAEALSQQNGPDVVLIPQTMLLRQQNKIYQIPYGQNTITAGQYQASFLDVANVFLDQNGIWAVPLVVDPLVAYWNRQHFTNEGLVAFPSNWDDFVNVVTKVTKKDANLTLLRNGVGLGTWDNVTNAQSFLNTLFLQQNSKLVYLNKENNYSVLSLVEDGVLDKTLTFYTNFTNPTKPEYTWNRTMPNDLQSFTSGRSSIYFGKASELANISQTNPNLNFYVAKMPQTKDSEVQATWGDVYGFALMKLSSNLTDAFRQINTLTSAQSIELLVGISNLPPVRRDVIQNTPSQAYMEVFYDSAIIANTWPDPNIDQSPAVYKNTIEQILLTNQNRQAMSYLLDNLNSLFY